MRVKITQKGWETYSDIIGTTQFKNGVSVEHISRVDAMALGAYVTVVEVDEDGNELGPVSPAHEALQGSKLRAPPVRNTRGPLSHIQSKPSHGEVENLTHDPEFNSPIEADRISKKFEAQRQAREDMLPRKVLLTENDLAAIASEKGINGLREIAEPLGVKGTSIKGMIAGVLQAQKRA